MNRSNARWTNCLSLLLLSMGMQACGDKLLGIGGSIAVTPTALAYPQTRIGAAESITVSVANQGSAPLSIGSIKVASDPNSELSLSMLLTTDCTGAVRSGNTSLSPGECAQFVATWNPNAVHPASGSIEIDSNDARNPVITLNVTGDVLALGCQFSNPACSGNQACCDNNCVDTGSDPADCGMCGHACSAGQTCNSGVCKTPGCTDSDPACTGSDACCNNACVSTQSDPLHCGGCNPCAAGQDCKSGVCVDTGCKNSDPACTAGTLCCDNACVDTQTDPLHCGGCNACAANQTCNSGVCTDVGCASSNPACDIGQSCCGDMCFNTKNDPLHCGGCNPCAAGDTCAVGVCIPPVTNNSCDPVTAPCSGANICCNHVCINGTPTGGICPCTGGPTSSFGVGSIIIPMDVCWQRGQDVTTTPAYCTNNRKTTSDDSPLKAYGLVFFLIRHQVTVYVAIDPAKSAIDGVDMSLTTTGSTPPVQRYNWATGQAVALTDTTQKTVGYRGGPFLIDASQHDNVLHLLATDPDFAQFRTKGNINIHIATVAFQSTIAKSIAAVPSRIALLAPKGDNSSYQILVRYLTSAGLNFTGAGGTPAAPGQIYDQLQESDFLPNLASSNLGKGGYKLLWSPHWDGGTSNTNAQLATIAAFVNAGGDLFAECAAVGTLEGLDDLSFGPPSGITGGTAATRFMSTKGMAGNTIPASATNGSGSYTGPFVFGGLASPFAQRGDFPYEGFTGAIADYHPDISVSSTYRPGVVSYVSTTGSDGNKTDLFTSYDQHSVGKGTVVYLAGHDYSYGGTGDTVGTTAGSRLVLNTLFSLGTNDVCQP